MSSRWERLAPIERAVEYGTAELVPDPRRSAAWTLLVDGVAQSYVDLSDPTWVEFEYLRLIAAVLDVVSKPGAPLRVLHLGGGALSLPRYVHATRPGSTQEVIERDPLLYEMVRDTLPVPATVTVQIADARTAVQASTDRSFDVVVSDVYQGAQMPHSVASLEFAVQVARILRPEGVYVVNVTDLPGLLLSRRHAATLRQCFGQVCAVGEPGMLRGRRFGNVVLAAAGKPDRLPVARLAARAGRAGPPDQTGPYGRVVHGAQLDAFIANARPVTDSSPWQPVPSVPMAVASEPTPGR